MDLITKSSSYISYRHAIITWYNDILKSRLPLSLQTIDPVLVLGATALVVGSSLVVALLLTTQRFVVKGTIRRRAMSRKMSMSSFEVRFRDVKKVENDIANVAVEIMGWDKDDGIKIEAIQGGITNLLWKVSNVTKNNNTTTTPAIQYPVCLVRVYGANTEAMIDRDRERVLFNILSDLQIGPKLHGEFGNGRIEGYFDGLPLDHKFMGSTSPIDFPALIACELARLHKTQDMPVEKIPQIWKVLDKWIALCLKVEFPNDAKKSAWLKRFDLPGFVKEIEWLKKVLPSSENFEGLTLDSGGAHGPSATAVLSIAFRPVFAHNDALCGNILYLKKENRCQLIDFEYGGYNYVAFDVANHFCEYAGFEFDYERWYPSNPSQEHFWLEYLRHCDDDDMLPTGHNPEMLLPGLVYWTNRFSLLPNAMWFLWSVLQAANSTIDVDFFDYANKRRSAYFAHKNKFFSEGEKAMS
jgi:ethanolamine kinase